MDKVVDWIPGLKGIRLRELPSFIRNTGHVNDTNYVLFKFIIQEVERIPQASALLVNTFDELEPDAVEALRSKFPNVYTIGPLHLLCNQFPMKDDLKSIGGSLWKEDAHCLKWLDIKEVGLVVYVNF